MGPGPLLDPLVEPLFEPLVDPLVEPLLPPVPEPLPSCAMAGAARPPMTVTTSAVSSAITNLNMLVKLEWRAI